MLRTRNDRQENTVKKKNNKKLINKLLDDRKNMYLKTMTSMKKMKMKYDFI